METFNFFKQFHSATPEWLWDANGDGKIDKADAVFALNNNVSAHLCYANEYILSQDEQDELMRYIQDMERDYKIEDTKQGSIGDCWLLSGVNALSYTQAGRDLLRDVLDYKPDENKTTVHLKGFGDIDIGDDEVLKAKNSRQYSNGDEDMVIIELAIEKALDSIVENKYVINPHADWYVENPTEIMNDKNESRFSISGGNVAWSVYLLTGKAGTRYTGEDTIKSKLLKYKNINNKSVAIGASLNEDKTLKDSNGEKIELPGSHAYAIKNITTQNGKTYVSVVNPHDTKNKSYEFDIDTFVSEFDSIEITDLSSNNPDIDFIGKKYTKDKDDNRTYSFDCSNIIFLNDNMQEVSYVREDVTYNKDGNQVKTCLYDKDGKVCVIRNYNGQKNGELLGYVEFTSSVGVYNDFDKETKGKYLCNADKTGNIINKTKISNDEYKRLASSGLLNYSQLLPKEMCSLLKLDEVKFSKAMEYLQNYPNASYNDISANI